MRSTLKYLWLLSCVVTILAALPILYFGLIKLDPQGAQNGSCFSEPLPPTLNGRGMVASGHHTFCDDIIHDSAVYIYLHKAGDADAPNSLIFRYADDGTTAPAKIEWKDANTLSIAVGAVLQVTKLVESVDGVAIRYAIGREPVPREAWDADVRHLEYFLGFLIAVLVLAALSGALVIKSIAGDRRVS
jgi:hypothetical protein